MDDSRKELYQDLEQYIREHWIPSKEEIPEPQLREDVDEENDLEWLDESGSDSWDSDEAVSDGRLPAASEKNDLRKGTVFDSSPSSGMSLEDLISEVGKSFHEMLFEMIAESGMTDVEVYKRANIDRKLFSKIRNNPAYHPRKSTVLALAIALKLNLPQTQEMLARAEYALSPASKSDVLISYFIEKKIHDIDTINTALYDHDLPILE